jgi:hypothetical protein
VTTVGLPWSLRALGNLDKLAWFDRVEHRQNFRSARNYINWSARFGTNQNYRDSASSQILLKLDASIQRDKYLESRSDSEGQQLSVFLACQTCLGDGDTVVARQVS